jgi:SpoVK/Ycf46/Vps4 family AAA+-type ATPase
MNVRDASFVINKTVESAEQASRFAQVWKLDFTAVPATPRRAARYVLQLISADEAYRKELQESPENIDPVWKLVKALIDEQAMNDAFAAFVASQSDKRDPGERLHQWQTKLLLQLPHDLLQRLAREDGDEPTNPCVHLLAAVLGLNSVERALLDFVEKRVSVKSFGRFLACFERDNATENNQRLAYLLNVSASAVRSALAKKSALREMELLESGRRDFLDLEDFVTPSSGLQDILAASPSTEQELREFLMDEAPAAEWKLADFPHMEASAQRLRTALHSAAHNRVAGVNALLFGPTGTGKTEFALSLAQAAGLRLYRVRCDDEDGEGMGRQGRLTAYLVIQRLLKSRDDALILFDEIEDVFAGDEQVTLRMHLSGRQTGGKEKGWMNRLLEENQVPTIWITNEVAFMDAAFLRRYLLPVEFSVPPRAVRRRMAERHLGNCTLPARFLDELAADDKLAPAQLGAARKLLTLYESGQEARQKTEPEMAETTGTPDGEPAETIVREGVAAMRRLLHGSGLPRVRRSPTRFDAAFLNVAGGIAPARLVDALERLGHGRLCLYGPPGTGKTEFAHVLADALGRELVAKQASDLISPYVGQTESNIAALFSTFDAERSVLLLDEVDTFLRSRQQAKHSWEISQVNELLQQMENFLGIFIAATNLVEGLDAAALRRFDFKLHFKPLLPAQRLALFAREALGDAARVGEIPPVLVNRLETLEELTAGDFANVCRQRDLLGENLTAENFLRRLAQECRWKMVAAAA